MSDTPTLIGRNRAPSRVASLGYATPTIGSAYRTRGQETEKVEPKTGEQLRAEEAARRDAEPVIARCGLCDDFMFDGTVADARNASRAHRADVHPETLKTKKPKRDNLKSWGPQNDEEQKAEAMKNVMERRAFTARSELGEAAAGRLGPDGAASPSRRPSPAQAAILEYLASGPKRLSEIAAHQGTRMATNGKTLHRLSARGLVVKHGHGLYALAPAQKKAA